ncbi:MAG TPA: ABC transporter permease subunit [Microbacterium sp.]|uniref:ABC transporter permease n=1 Tax=Microbacterium sp. TaxID=51671 RepID=UPI002CDF9931|nr:ABC transporter permease subunit [Microbacterium sp.]HWI30812.1 ABC transporter permease subunit [Microbacterium sp.]
MTAGITASAKASERIADSPTSTIRTARRQVKWGSFALANGIPLLILLAWALAAPGQPAYLLPAPLDVAEDVVQLTVGPLAFETLTSFARIIVALVISMLIGGGLVLLTQLMPVFNGVVSHRLLPLLNAVPSVGWAILGVIWLGVSDAAVIFVVALIILPFSMVTLREGLKAIDPDLREMGRSFTRSRLSVFGRIEFTLLLPYVLAAARLSFSVGWKVAIIAEFFGAEAGIGLVMNQARQTFDTSMVFATIIVIAMIVYVVDTFVFEALSNYVSRRMGATQKDVVNQ